ncbi:MAG: type VI secretion protein IcmF/TssM N-terminal domain-containing protein [Geminicoccaceae bacterium]
MTLLHAIHEHLPWLLIGLSLVTVLLMGLIWRTWKRSRKAVGGKPSPKASSQETAGQPSLMFRVLSGVGFRTPAGVELALLRSFHAAGRQLRRYAGGRGNADRLPWYLMIGPQGAGRSCALAASDLHLPLGPPSSSAALGNDALAWWVFEQGVVIEPAPEVVGLPEVGSEPDRRWRHLSRLLQWYRPRRPLNGIIVALPADLFIGEQRRSVDMLADLGKLIDRRLGAMQRRLGLSLPLYVLVTKCDLIAGFEPFWQAAPPAKRHEIFGWSSPYGVDRAAKAEWLDEAFQTLGSRLRWLQLEQGADAGNPSADSFLFPRAFEEAAETLKQCLRPLLHATGSPGAMPFRGLYFSGSAEPVAGTAQQLVISADTSNVETGGRATLPEPGMLSHLLAEKVFREQALARPQADSFSVRNRQVRLAQTAFGLALVLGTAALFGATRELSDDVTKLKPHLREIRETVLALQEREREVRSADIEELSDLDFADERDIGRLLEAMGRFETDTFGSVFLPTSLASSVNDELAAFLSHGFDTVIMRAMYNQLRVRTERALAQADRARRSAGANDRSSLSVGDEVARLRSFVAELYAIDGLAKLYNDLGTTRNLEHLSKLSTELFGTDLPPAMSMVSHLVRDALGQVNYEPFDATAFRDRATTRARQLNWDVHDALLKAGTLERALFDLTRDLAGFSDAIGDSDAMALRVRDLRAKIAAVKGLLAHPEVAWASSETLELGDGYRSAVEMIASTAFFSADLAAEISGDGQRDFERFRTRLAAYEAPIVGPILERANGELQMTLSSNVADLAERIDQLFAEPFMAVPPARQIVTAAGDGSLGWTTAELDEALALYASFDRFAANALAGFPEALRRPLYDLAMVRVANAITAAIAEAQTLEQGPSRAWAQAQERGIERRLDGFAAAAPRVDRLIRILDQLGVEENRAKLARLTQAQASVLLFDLDDMLEREGAYLPPGSIALWDGETPLNQAAYAFADDLQARAYLGYQRERLAYMAENLARPLIDFLDRHDQGLSERARRSVFRWRAIADELKRYDKRQADSSLAALERFIRFDLAKIDKGGCGEPIATGGRFGAATANYFLDRLRQIETLAQERCLELVSDDIANAYGMLARAFTRELAGRYPFGTGSYSDEVDPGTLASFFEAHGDTIVRVADRLEALSLEQERLEPHARFAEALRDVYVFFAGVDRLEPFQHHLGAAFRVARDREVLANHVLDWRLAIGDRRVIDGERQDPVIWRVGDPIRLSLRWAANAPRRPADLGRDEVGHLSVDGTVARFTYGGAWALVRLVDDQRVRDADALIGPPHLLAFAVPTLPAEGDAVEDGLAGDPITAKGFWRLAVSRTGEPGAPGLTVPRFPASAPDLPRITPVGGRP